MCEINQELYIFNRIFYGRVNFSLFSQDIILTILFETFLKKILVYNHT